MKLSISTKLVLTFLGVTLLVLIATLALARWSFERGFLDYVNAQEQHRLEIARDRFAAHYQAAGNSWDQLTRKQFHDLLRPSGHPRARPKRPRHQDRPPVSDHRAGPGQRPPPPRHKPPRRSGPPTALYDQQQQILFGNKLKGNIEALIRVPITVNDTTIGELRTEPRHQFSSPQETAFAKQQLTMSWIIGLASLAFATLVSLLAARGLLAPVKRMLGNVSKLSAGDYSVRLQDQREDELGELMGNLNQLASTLEQERSSRRRWLADISHELRTPLAILAGEIEALKDGVRELNSQQIESLDQEVKRLTLLVNDLYDLSISDVGGLRYQYTDFELRACIDAVAESLQNKADLKGLAMTVSGAQKLEIEADIDRIDQLILNLLDNSITYTDAPGKIEIRLNGTTDRIAIEIHDTAPGVDKDECDRLFEPLYRRDSSRSRRSGGAGLGLAICQKIVAAHGGTISASPSELGGLRIHISLPTRASQAHGQN